jgi:hypothetical protein
MQRCITKRLFRDKRSGILALIEAEKGYMKRLDRLVLVAFVIFLTVAASSQGATFSDFESPTYTADTSFSGVDGWSVFAGSTFRARVSPTTDPDDLSVDTTVLEAAQSGWVKSVQPYRLWNGVENFVGDGLQISWLMQPTALTRTELYMSDNPGIGNTPVGMVLDAAGNIKIQAQDSGLVDTGFDYLANKTYRMLLLFDFTAKTMRATAENVTDAGPVINLGSVFMSAAFTTPASIATIKSTGGLYLVERDGNVTYFDDIQVVPEPSSALLLVLAGLVWMRRRTGQT